MEEHVIVDSSFSAIINAPLTWLTDTAISGAPLYWENKFLFFGVKGVSIPVVVSVFPDELYPAPRSWAEKAYPRLIHYNRLPKGGHFVAWERPKLLSEEIRTGFRSLRNWWRKGCSNASVAPYTASDSSGRRSHSTNPTFDLVERIRGKIMANLNSDYPSTPR